jgi:hypothetical protein
MLNMTNGNCPWLVAGLAALQLFDRLKTETGRGQPTRRRLA